MSIRQPSVPTVTPELGLEPAWSRTHRPAFGAVALALRLAEAHGRKHVRHVVTAVAQVNLRARLEPEQNVSRNPVADRSTGAGMATTGREDLVVPGQTVGAQATAGGVGTGHVQAVEVEAAQLSGGVIDDPWGRGCT